MIPSNDLREMLGQLAQLDPGEREFVLAELGDSAGQRLLPLIEAASRLRMSEPLAQAAAGARQGLTPAGMTGRAAQALVEAAKEHDRAVNPAAGNKTQKSQSLVEGLLHLVRGRT